MTRLDFAEITKERPEKSLTRGITRSGGRNNDGHETCRFRGGGHKRRYRLIDFKRDKRDIPARVATIEYDPNRTAASPCCIYADGEKRYILAPDGLQVGRRSSWPPRRPRSFPGNALPLKNIPARRHGPQRRAAPRPRRPDRAVGRHRGPAHGEGRQVRDPPHALGRDAPGAGARAGRPIGQVGNVDHSNVSIGKAGRMRWMGRRGPRARHGHEPGRPPARRRRGQDQGRPSTRSRPGASPPRGTRPARTSGRTRFIVKRRK